LRPPIVLTLSVLSISTPLLFLLTAIVPACAQEPSFRFSYERLTLDAGITAISPYGDGFVAVGKAGAVIIYKDSRLHSEKVVGSDLVDVDCGEGFCVAVGAGGVLVVIRPDGMSFEPRRVLGENDRLSVVKVSGERAAMASGRRLLVYKAGAVESILDVPIDVVDLEWSGDDRVTVLGSSSTLSISLKDGEPIPPQNELQLGKAKARSMHLHLGGLWVHADDGIYRLDGGAPRKVVDGAYALARKHPRGFVLVGRDRVVLYDVAENRTSLLSTVWFKVADAAYGRLGTILVGERGEVGVLDEKGLKLLTLQASEYAAIAGTGNGAFVIGSRGEVLEYSGGFFRAVGEVGDEPRAVSAIPGGRAVILGKRSIWLVGPGYLSSLSLRVSAGDFNAISPSGDGWLVLAGRGGRLVKASLEGDVVPINATGRDLLAASSSYAVGERVAVRIAPQVVVAEVDDRLVGVAETECSGIAIAESGKVIVLRDGSVAALSLGKHRLRTISMRPDGSYALIGTADGSLILFDGYAAWALPVSVGEEVKGIAWTGKDEALVMTRKALYRVKEEHYPQPSLRIELQNRFFEVYAGSSTVVPFTLAPLNGFSGKPDVSVEKIGMGEYIALRTPSIALKPMCPVDSSILATASDDAPEGEARIRIRADGAEAEVTLIVKRPRHEGGQQALPIVLAIQAATLLGATLLAYFAVKRFLKGRRGSMQAPGEWDGETS